jgi:hypothetical protein
MYLNETYSTARIGKNLSDKFPIQNGLKQGDLYHHSFSTLLCNTPLGATKRPVRDETQRDSPDLAHDDDVNTVGENIDTIKKNTTLY